MLSWVFNQPTIGGSMTHKNVWFITGAGRGMGVHIARAALAAGNAVVATGRNTDTVTKAVGEADDLLVVKLDVTRAELPVMRAQRSGLVVTISSTAGIRGGEFLTAYAASKFGVEGWMESLTPEVAPFGIRTMLVEPGFFRTELLTPESTNYAEPTIEDYAEKTRQTVTAWSGMNGLQGGDPAKLARALVQLASQDEPPLRWAAGADAVEDLEQKAQRLLAQANAYRELSSSLAHDDTNA